MIAQLGPLAAGSFAGRGAFWIGFALAAAATGTIAGGVGWLVAQKLVRPSLARFESSVFEFDLPPGWHCDQEGTEHVCNKGQPPHAAVAILTMKYRGPQDTPSAYRDHLSRVRTSQTKAGKTLVSQVVSVGARHIAGREWVVGRQFESEITGYYTDYYASLTSHVAILVTFSSHRQHVEQTRAEFETMIASLKVYQLAPELLSRP